MSTQIAVQLPDDLVEFIDEVIERGDANSRAAVVTRALEQQHRQAITVRDAEILARASEDTDLDGLAYYTAQTPMDDLV